MSSLSVRGHRALAAAAAWLPFVFGATLLQNRAAAQTTGNVSPMSGVCTVSASATVTCSRTNGTPFAASATTDTTNAGNITAGTLPVAQTAALTGGVSKAAGSSVTKVQVVPSSSITAAGDSLTEGNQAGDGVNYPGLLQALTGRYVRNLGYSGNTSAQVLTRLTNTSESYDDFVVLWSGRNDAPQSIANSTTLANIATSVNLLGGSTRYVVLSVINSQAEPSGSSAYSNIVSLNGTLASTYGSRYVDIRSALVAAYNAGNGADVANHNADLVPLSLRAVLSSTATLSSALGSTGCPVSTYGAYTAGLTYSIDSEYITINSVSGGQPATCTRGYGSTAATHSTGATVTVVDYLHLNAAGYQVVANAVASYLAANDPRSGSRSSYMPVDALQNIRLGADALANNTTGAFNLAGGTNALGSNTTGYANTAIGWHALMNNTTGYQNTALNYMALVANTTGYNNVATSRGGLYSNTTGYGNVAAGYAALSSNTAGNLNTAAGQQAGVTNTTGNNNTYLGPQAGQGNASGSQDTFVGYLASTPGGTVRNYMTVIGAGASGDCSNCVVLGRSTDMTFANGGLTVGPAGVLQTLTTPASSSTACTAGQLLVDANYVYVCTAANTYKRAALTAF